MCNIESNLRPYLTDSEKNRGWEIHDKIKNHPYRISFEPFLMEEYGDLVYKMCDLVGTYVTDSDGNYPFHDYIKTPIKMTWKENAPTEDFYIDIYSNPNIGLLSKSIHAFNGIRWRLATAYKTNKPTEIVKTKFIETTELQLMLFHHLLLDDDITTIKFPSEYGYNTYTTYTLTKNPHFNNWWTDEFWMNNEFYIKEK